MKKFSLGILESSSLSTPIERAYLHHNESTVAHI